MRWSIQVHITFADESSFQMSLQRKPRWLYTMRDVGKNIGNYSISLAVITESEGNLMCTIVQYKKTGPSSEGLTQL